MQSGCFLSESTVGAVTREHNTTHLASFELHEKKYHTHTHTHTHAPMLPTQLQPSLSCLKDHL